MRLAVAASLVLFAAGCAPKVAPAPPGPTPQARLEQADKLLHAGCFDCLTAALDAYTAARTSPRATPPIVDAATVGAVRAMLLLDLRQRELGMADDGYLKQAHSLTADREPLKTQFAAASDMISTISWRGRTGDLELDAIQKQVKNRVTWLAQFREHAADDDFSAYAWLALACSTGEAARLMQAGFSDFMAPLTPFVDEPLIQYRLATCPGPRQGRIPAAMSDEGILVVKEREPRFAELDYLIGVRRITEGKLDDADAALRRAFDWHARWPAVSISIANVALTAEDYEGALDFYEKTIALEPQSHEALLGRIRALSYLNRHEDAIARIDEMLKGSWFRGQALYWRAWNHTQLDKNDQAWDDIEAASKLSMTSDVAKLAGMIAYRRQQLDVSRSRFEAGRKMNEGDCEMGFYLGLVDAELRRWQDAVDVFVSNAPCLELSRAATERDIERIRASNTPEDRKAKKIARREQRVAIDTRRLATSWFNAAVGSFNLNKVDDARQYAGKVSADAEYGERAREILSRLKGLY
jgi:tetratricopeptide (TPR) repeat protein